MNGEQLVAAAEQLAQAPLPFKGLEAIVRDRGAGGAAPHRVELLGQLENLALELPDCSEGIAGGLSVLRHG